MHTALPMTKATRRTVMQLIQLASLCRFRAGDSQSAGRTADAAAYLELAGWLMDHAHYALSGPGLLRAPRSMDVSSAEDLAMRLGLPGDASAN